LGWVAVNAVVGELATEMGLTNRIEAGGSWQRWRDVPRQKFVDTVGRMIGDALNDVVQIDFGINGVQAS
jgi:hypothetical protein